MEQAMMDFLKTLESEGRESTAAPYELALRHLNEWLEKQHVAVLGATSEQLQAFQCWLADEYKTADGKRLKKSTQQTRLIPVLAFYRWAERLRLILSNPAKKLKLPKVPRRNTPKDYVDLQEATALIQTQARRVVACKVGSFKWAEESRNLAIISMALATGRRRQSLLSLTLNHVDLQRNELRIEWEKGKAGRVLPVAKWAMDIVRIYLNGARRRLIGNREDKGYLFPGTVNEVVAGESFRGTLERIHHRAVEENPDLEGFGDKHLSPHSLRVSFATLLFKGGCNIRSVNELMLHSSLSTTARYTPIPLEDLRRACRLAHPRA